MSKIKKRKEELFRIIANANIELEKLRKSCPHKNTFKGIYSRASGYTFYALICDDCGECLVNLDLIK